MIKLIKQEEELGLNINFTLLHVTLICVGSHQFFYTLQYYIIYILNEFKYKMKHLLARESNCNNGIC